MECVDKGLNDMTTGSCLQKIMVFFVPMMLGTLFQQLYNMADTIIVGKCLGLKTLAAVGATSSLNFMIIGFCTGICSGFAIPAAQMYGARKLSDLRRFVANSLWLSLIFAVGITLWMLFLCKQIMTWMGTPYDIYDDAVAYIRIVILGIPAIFLYNLTAGIIRSLGDSRTPLFFLILSSVLNIILDIVFIVGLHFGVSGAAAATVISQFFSGAACLAVMKNKFPILQITREEWSFHWKYSKVLLKIGLPMGLQYSITAIGSVILQTAVNSLGSQYVACVTAGTKVSTLLCCPYDAMGSTMATYAGQNTGAGKYKRIITGLKSCIIVGVIYSLLACVCIFCFGDKMAGLFINKPEPALLGKIHLFLKVNSLGYFLLFLVNVVRYTIQGMGYSFAAIFAGVCEMLIRAVVAFVFVPLLGYIAVCSANPAAWLAADAFLIPMFVICFRRLSGTRCKR